MFFFYKCMNASCAFSGKQYKMIQMWSMAKFLNRFLLITTPPLLICIPIFGRVAIIHWNQAEWQIIWRSKRHGKKILRFNNCLSSPALPPIYRIYFWDWSSQSSYFIKLLPKPCWYPFPPGPDPGVRSGPLPKKTPLIFVSSLVALFFFQNVVIFSVFCDCKLGEMNIWTI